MQATVIPVIEWAEDPLPPEASVPMHRRGEVVQTLTDRPEMGANLVVLNLKYGDRWAVTSTSTPGTWHSVVVVEHGEMVGARCSSPVSQFCGVAELLLMSG